MVVKLVEFEIHRGQGSVKTCKCAIRHDIFGLLFCHGEACESVKLRKNFSL